MRLGPEWFRGSADALYQSLNVITDEEPDYVFVFGADHVYKMDVRQMLDFHHERRPTSPSRRAGPVAEASEFGVIAVDDEGRIVGFAEKPSAGPPRCPGAPASRLASMGNYLFTTAALVRSSCATPQRARSRTTSANILPSMSRARASSSTTSRERGPGQRRARARLLARRRHPGRLLPGEHGPRRGGSDLLALQRPVADLHGAVQLSARQVRVQGADRLKWNRRTPYIGD